MSGENTGLHADVEPLLPLALDGVDFLQGEIGGVATHLNPEATEWVGTTAAHVPPNVEDGLP